MMPRGVHQRDSQILQIAWASEEQISHWE